MGKGQRKPPVYFLRGKKRPVDGKDVYKCTHCKAGFQGKSEHDEHQNKCRMRVCILGFITLLNSLQFNFVIANHLMHRNQRHVLQPHVKLPILTLSLHGTRSTMQTNYHYPQSNIADHLYSTINHCQS